MSYKTKADSLADAIPHTPVVRTYRCAAHGCQMPGAIFDNPGQPTGVCAYHYAANPVDWPRITQALAEWECVTSEIRECRRVHTASETAAKPAVLSGLFGAAVARLEPLVGPHWWEQLKPQPGRGGVMDSYASWGWRLEKFIGARVQEQTIAPRRRLAA